MLRSIASNVGACRILGALGEETSANSWTVPLTLAPVVSLFLWAGADRDPKAPFCMGLFYDPPKKEPEPLQRIAMTLTRVHATGAHLLAATLP